MTKYGETQNFRCEDFVRNLESFIGRAVDVVLYNNTRPDTVLADLYALQKSEFVEIDPQGPFWGQRKLYTKDLLETSNRIIRHNSKKIAALLHAIFYPGQ